MKQKTKLVRLYYAIAAIIVVVILVSVFSKKPENPEGQNAQKTEKQEQVMEQKNFKKKKTEMMLYAKEIVAAEKSVLDAAVDEYATAVYFGVSDDGTNRDGLAEYLCLEFLAKSGYQDLIVHVMDQHSKEMRELGKAYCRQ